MYSHYEKSHLPILQYPQQIRNNKGDFVLGFFFLRELWNPFQNMAQILKQVYTCI